MYDLIQVLLMHCTGSSTLYCTGIAGGYCCCCCYCCSFGGPSELHSNLKSYTPPYCMHWQKHCSTGIAGGHCQMIEVGKSRLQIDFTFFSTLFSLSHLSLSIICFQSKFATDNRNALVKYCKIQLKLVNVKCKLIYFNCMFLKIVILLFAKVLVLY